MTHSHPTSFSSNEDPFQSPLPQSQHSLGGGKKGNKAVELLSGVHSDIVFKSSIETVWKPPTPPPPPHTLTCTNTGILKSYYPKSVQFPSKALGLFSVH